MVWIGDRLSTVSDLESGKLDNRAKMLIQTELYCLSHSTVLHILFKGVLSEITR